jgi:hypothetical protein
MKPLKSCESGLTRRAEERHGMAIERNTRNTGKIPPRRSAYFAVSKPERAFQPWCGTHLLYAVLRECGLGDWFFGGRSMDRFLRRSWLPLIGHRCGGRVKPANIRWYSSFDLALQSMGNIPKVSPEIAWRRSRWFVLAKIQMLTPEAGSNS